MTVTARIAENEWEKFRKLAKGMQTIEMAPMAMGLPVPYDFLCWFAVAPVLRAGAVSLVAWLLVARSLLRRRSRRAWLVGRSNHAAFTGYT